MPAAKLTAHDLRRVSVEADVDPRSVAARLEGRRQRCTIAARIDKALRALGFVPPDVATGSGAPPASQTSNP